MKTRYRIIQSKAIPFGGLYLVDEFLEKLSFHRIFNFVFGRYRKVRKNKLFFRPGLVGAVGGQVNMLLCGRLQRVDYPKFHYKITNPTWNSWTA